MFTLNSGQATCPVAINRIIPINKVAEPVNCLIFRITFLPLPELQFSNNIPYQKDIFQNQKQHNCHNISASALEILI